MLGSIVSIGTHFHVALGDDGFNILKESKIKRTTPQETIPKIVDFFQNETPEAIGIGSFGPIDIDPSSKKYGYITSTPKFGWEYFNFLGELQKHFSIPLAWNTNANVSALGEYFIHSSEDIRSLLYLTFGTGVGGGFIYEGEIFQKVCHPEMGHILIERLEEDKYSSHCPYHNNCLEGMANRSAIMERTQKKFEEIHEEDPAFDTVANYIAQALVDVTMILRPDRIVLGGVMMNNRNLIKKTKNYFSVYFNHYLQIPPIDEYIYSWDPNEKPGTIGAFLIAQRALEKSKP